jgi:hypothetical protein
MKQIRQFHLYLGTFFAPVIFFFALSGALQTFGLHENEEDGSYNAPAWIATMAEIHKDQRLAKPHRPHPQAAPAENAPAHDEHPPAAAPGDEHKEAPSSLPLKCFVLLLAIGLMVTAALGIYMALQSRNNRRITWFMLAGGVIVPIVLLFL